MADLSAAPAVTSAGQITECNLIEIIFRSLVSINFGIWICIWGNSPLTGQSTGPRKSTTRNSTVWSDVLTWLIDSEYTDSPLNRNNKCEGLEDSVHFHPQTQGACVCTHRYNHPKSEANLCSGQTQAKLKGMEMWNRKSLLEVQYSGKGVEAKVQTCPPSVAMFWGNLASQSLLIQKDKLGYMTDWTLGRWFWSK